MIGSECHIGHQCVEKLGGQATRALSLMSEYNISKAYVTTVTYIEYLGGAPLDRKADTQKFLRIFEVIPFDETTQRQAEYMARKHVMKSGEAADFLIACVARAKGLTIITDNVKHFNFGIDVRVIKYDVGAWLIGQNTCAGEITF